MVESGTGSPDAVTVMFIAEFRMVSRSLRNTAPCMVVEHYLRCMCRRSGGGGLS